MEEGYGNVFQLSRPQQTGSGRWDFIGQTRTDFWDVSNCEEVLFTSDAKPILQSLSGGGHYNNEFELVVVVPTAR